MDFNIDVILEHLYIYTMCVWLYARVATELVLAKGIPTSHVSE